MTPGTMAEGLAIPSNTLSFHLKELGHAFAAEPARLEADYAKVDARGPAHQLAISTRGGKPGVDHLGIQTDTEDELAELKTRAQAADLTLLDEGAVSCCYARSEKHWVTDPQGIAWEHFRTLSSIPVFSEKAKAVEGTESKACCAAPAAAISAVTAPAKQTSCC